MYLNTCSGTAPSPMEARTHAGGWARFRPLPASRVRRLSDVDGPGRHWVAVPDDLRSTSAYGQKRISEDACSVFIHHTLWILRHHLHSPDMINIPLAPEPFDDIKIYYVYLIACHAPLETCVKVGMTCNLKRRISEVQTGCPFRIAHAFAIPSEYWEEARGLEKLLHMLLREQRLRGEWYSGTETFFSVLDAVLRRINAGGFSYEELLETPDFVGPEFEIMLHHHDFCFYEISLPLVRGADPMDSARSLPAERIASALSGGRATQYGELS